MSLPLENFLTSYRRGLGDFPPCSQNLMSFPCHSTHHMELQWSVSTTGLAAMSKVTHMAILCGMCEPPLQIATEPSTSFNCSYKLEWKKQLWKWGMVRQRQQQQARVLPSLMLAEWLFWRSATHRCVCADTEWPHMPVSFSVWLCGADVCLGHRIPWSIYLFSFDPFSCRLGC